MYGWWYGYGLSAQALDRLCRTSHEGCGSQHRNAEKLIGLSMCRVGAVGILHNVGDLGNSIDCGVPSDLVDQ
jgi:hypothetical protein